MHIIVGNVESANQFVENLTFFQQEGNIFSQDS